MRYPQAILQRHGPVCIIGVCNVFYDRRAPHACFPFLHIQQSRVFYHTEIKTFDASLALARTFSCIPRNSDHPSSENLPRFFQTSTNTVKRPATTSPAVFKHTHISTSQTHLCHFHGLSFRWLALRLTVSSQTSKVIVSSALHADPPKRWRAPSSSTSR